MNPIEQLLETNPKSMSQDERSHLAMHVRPFEFAIGRLVMNFGVLEFSVFAGIGELQFFNPEPKPNEPRPSSFGPSVDKYQEFAANAAPMVVKEESHRKLIAEMKRFGKQRNEYVHGAWFDVPDTDIDQRKSKLRRKGKLIDLYQELTTGYHVTPIEIIEFSNRVIGLKQRFNAQRDVVYAAAKARAGAGSTTAIR